MQFPKFYGENFCLSRQQGKPVLRKAGFSGSLPGFSVLLAGDINGDINGDSRVDVADVMALAQQIVNGSTSTQYDFNQDGILDVLDVMTLAQQIVNQTVSR